MAAGQKGGQNFSSMDFIRLTLQGASIYGFALFILIMTVLSTHESSEMMLLCLHLVLSSVLWNCSNVHFLL